MNIGWSGNRPMEPDDLIALAEVNFFMHAFSLFLADHRRQADFQGPWTSCWIVTAIYLLHFVDPDEFPAVPVLLPVLLQW